MIDAAVDVACLATLCSARQRGGGDWRWEAGQGVQAGPGRMEIREEGKEGREEGKEGRGEGKEVQ